MEFAVLANCDGWKWHLLAHDGTSICSSCRAFSTARQAFENLLLAKDALSHAPIVDTVGRMAEMLCGIHYVQ